MPSTTLRNRAVHLLETFFEDDEERTRRYILSRAFDGFKPNPANGIDFSGPVVLFAAEVVDKLLAFGCLGRGKHPLSVLLETMASVRGRQSHRDYAEIPEALDATCALPTGLEEHRYLTRLIHDIEEKARLYSPLSGIASTRPEAPELEPWADDPALELFLRHQSRQETAPPARDYSDILSAFQDVKRAALLGAPGSGKSTTLRKFALELARTALNNPDAPLPLLAALSNWTGDHPLEQFLAEQAPEIGWAVEALAKAGKLVLLLDGLNEVPTAKRTAKAEEIRNLCTRLKKLNSHVAIVASCRREDYTGELDLGFDTLTLEPLSPQRIRRALHHWVTDRGKPPQLAEQIFWQLAGDERLSGVLETWLAAGATEEAFWTVSKPDDDKLAYAKTNRAQDALWSLHIPNPRSLLRLASNPYMLTMLFLVRWTEGELPRNRGELFARFVDTLLRKEAPGAQGEQVRGGLTELAWCMQTQPVEKIADGVLLVASRHTALECLSSPALLKKAQDSTLVEGSETIHFRHQLLQEYFTARALRTRIENHQTRAEDLWPADRWWQRTGWEETAVLLAGLYGEDCSAVIRWLANAQPEVAVKCILESGSRIADQTALLSTLQRAWLPRLTDLQREPAPEARAAVGRALGSLKLDGRQGVCLRKDGLPDIDWVYIPEGEFLYQKEKRKIQAFEIARYPVTNIQYQAFLTAPDGYADDRWWQGLTGPDRTPRSPTWSETNHPRETVSWQEAMAFCAWLGHKLTLDVRLPTEWEWERAAGGTDGREFPWGNQYQPGYANIDEIYGDAGPHYLARTSPVGIYPQGASPEGVLDLTGNVWEWCLNEYEKPDHIQPEGTKSRVLRGGSWFLHQDDAGAGYRLNNHPLIRDSSFGFRVVVSSPIRNAEA